jgi:glycosyltransferase involved in cell wall biosynthesis
MNANPDVKEFGVSVVICTHNGAARLPATLQHLKNQRDWAGLKWEVLIIDNASTDGTAEVVRECWKNNRHKAPKISGIPIGGTASVKRTASADEATNLDQRFGSKGTSVAMRIIRESRLGLTFARECALENVRYELVSFIDDDNWVGDTWVRCVADAMTAHPEAAIIGGYCEAAPEIAPPPWFARFKNYYAIGPDYERSTEVPMVWGAGLNLRRSAWLMLRENGFRFLTTAQCEDQEICLVARLAGWKVLFDATLRLQHFIPAGRLTWDYFRALQHKRTSCLVAIDPYLAALAMPTPPRHSVPISSSRRSVDDSDSLRGAVLEEPDSPNRLAASRDASRRSSTGGAWIHQFVVTAKNLLINLVRRPHKVFGRSSPRYEGDDDILRIENYLGRLEGLLRERHTYAQNLELVAGARWRDTAPVVAVADASDAAAIDEVTLDTTETAPTSAVGSEDAAPAAEHSRNAASDPLGTSLNAEPARKRI